MPYNPKNMTESQRIQFRAIVDLNWELKEEQNLVKKFEMANELAQKKQALREDMGHEAYDHFMEMGRKMFQPKQ